MGGDALHLWVAGGDLGTLLRNPALAELVGGIQRWAMWYLSQKFLEQSHAGVIIIHSAVLAHKVKHAC